MGRHVKPVDRRIEYYWSCKDCHDATMVDSLDPVADAEQHMLIEHGVTTEPNPHHRGMRPTQPRRKGRVYQDAKPHYYFDPGCA